MLSKLELREKIDEVIYWVYDYVRRSGATGVVVRKQWR